MDKKEFYNKLSDDVKEKIKACKTEEEMLKVLQDEKIELDPELLDPEQLAGVSGGNNAPIMDSPSSSCNKCGCN